MEQPPSKSFNFGPFIWAILGIIFATLLNFLISPIIGFRAPFLTYFTIITLCGWFGGMGSGIFAAILASFISNFIFTIPETQGVSQFGHSLRIVIFLIEGAVIAIITATARASDRRVRYIFESITDAFTAFDKKWRFTYLNSKAEKLFNKKRQDLIGKSLWEVYPDYVGTEMDKKFHQAISKKSPQEFEGHFKSLNRWFSVHAYPTRDGLAVYFTDTTIHHNLEEQKDEFLAVASHELKTPVTSIKAYTQLLASRVKEVKDDKASSYLIKLDEQVNRLGMLVADLLDFSRLQAGKVEFRKANIDINKLVEEIVEALSQSSPNHRLIIKGRVKKTTRGDWFRIGQILTNIINNAIKYSPVKAGLKKKVIITLKEERNHIQVSVQDFGIGIPAENIHRIFQRFYQASSSADKSISGLGLGLFITSQIVKRHGGRMWVESTVGKGSTFYFTLPIK